MARTKMLSIPAADYLGAGPDNALIEKSRPLLVLSQTSMTLPELKILDLYLSRIDPHDETKRVVIIEKGDLEQALGVSRISKPDLDRRLDHLFQVIKIPAENNRLHKIALMAEVDAIQDDTGIWQITLECTEQAREYIFNVESLGYLKYRLSLVVNLTSRYSYILVLYILDNRFRKSWRITVDKLREILQCNEPTYQAFKHLNDKILKPCLKEISEKTDLKFAYTPIKKWRTVEEIEFTIKPENKEQGQMEMSDIISDITMPTDYELMTKKYGSERMANLAANCRYEFSLEQMEILSAILNETNIPETNSSQGIPELEVWDYLSKKYKEFCVAAKLHNVKRRFEYFKKMLEKARTEG